ncbi:slipin family protein [Paenibacillus doosanensis]|uniref:slipin family protein n=1 Tax=Paenibacillus doosanensis TaxID=1229154 RepID=UPI0021804C01|nr:slipin family protein [Paenibacillus doosanensis]MCS7462285.1 slipin family protein [Paenibacillus doosanensis]
MWTTITVQNDERGLLFRDGSYIKPLMPGTYRLRPFSKERVTILGVTQPFAVPGKDVRLFLHDSVLLEELDVIRVADHEYVLHYEDGNFAGLLTAGTYAFWNVLKKHEYIRVDTRAPELPDTIEASILPKLSAYYQAFEVASHETGALFYNNRMIRELAPGKYYFWKGPVSVQVQTVDLRQQQMDMTGQEIMTEDKVTLRLNFVCQYRIVDPLRLLQIKSFQEQLYIQLQLILREYVGSLKLDDLLKMKQEIAAYVLTRLNGKSEEYGVQFLSAGLKDIVLPGDIKDILNTVLLAEKKAQANLITRREEIASTRSLLNTAKLMDENQTLFRLKELEFLEKICDKIGSISLTEGGNLLEQLNSLLGEKTPGKGA